MPEAFHHRSKDEPLLRLDEKRLALLEARPQEFTPLDLDFPCNDSSYLVEDFTEWSFFKKRINDDFKLKNMKNTHLWSPVLLNRIKRQRFYKFYIEEEKKSPIKLTRVAKLQKQIGISFI
jgi:hypothetical protein